MADQKTANNRKTGLTMAAVALFFFATVFIKRVWLG